MLGVSSEVPASQNSVRPICDGARHSLGVVLLLAPAAALDNGFGRRPPLAWSAWNSFGLSTTEDDVLETARALVSTGLAKLGFRTLNIDAGYLTGRDASGQLIVVQTTRAGTR